MMSVVQKFDNYVLVQLKKRVQNKYLDFIMPIITNMGTLGIIWIIIAVILMLDKPYRSIGDIVILTLIISTLLGEGIIKHLVRRIRPCNSKESSELLVSKPISYSFPSGHTLSSFAVAEVLSMYFNQYGIIFFTLAFLIAVSRIYLDVHYPTDIIAGAIIGLLCSKLVFIILQTDYLEKIVAYYKVI